MSILLQIGVKSENPLHADMAAGTDPDSMEAPVAPEDSKSYHPPPQTYASCFGLPYQDHNYGAPPPPSPPPSPPPQIKVLNGHMEVEDISGTTEVATTITTSACEDPALQALDDSITRCICDFDHDDGYMICCDKCSVWQHVDCMGLDRGNIPDVYMCECCQPRKVDKERARQIQIKKREELTDSSSTETEDETGNHKSSLAVGTTLTPQGKKSKGTKKNKKEKEKQQKKVEKKPKKVKKEKEKEKKKEKPPQTNKKQKKQQEGPKKKTAPKAAKTVKSPVSAPIHIPIPEGEEAQDPWASGLKVTGDQYEEVKANHYSSDIQKILSSKRVNGQHGEVVNPKPTEQLLVQLCRVAEVKNSCKGIEALEDMASNCPIIEYRGKVMLREQYDKENLFFKRGQPFVLFYSKYDNLDLCVDASSLGNDARYIRRSCTPNAEVRHISGNGRVHFLIYSSKGINKGTEVTIPFDFDYQECKFGVECACSKAGCPVTKFNKGEMGTTTKPAKKKRSSKSLGQKPSIDEGSKSNSPTKEKNGVRVAKKRKLAPLQVSVTNSQQEECKKEEEILVDPVATPTTEPSSAALTPTSAPAQLQLSSPEGSLDDAEARKKMTREERKMEAIMKAFEKLEKREERRKEALARLEHTKKWEKPKTVKEPQPEPPVEEKKVEVKPEKPKVVKGKKKNKGTGIPARRRSRMNSGSSVEPCLSTDESSNQASTPSTPMPTPGLEPGFPINTPPAALYNKAFKFPKTKKHLMNEWLSGEKSQDIQKPLSIKTEPLEVDTENADFVKCVPSPHTSSLTHLMRGSYCSATPPIKIPPTTNLDSSMGSAKKRWLRQAMFESTSHSPSGSMSPVPNGGMSPNPNSCGPVSPGALPQADFVTPLKKRRLARESMSMENPYPPTPSTPLSTPSTPIMDVALPGTATDKDGERFSNFQTDEQALNFDGTGRPKNGYRPHMSPITPGTPNDNLFERFAIRGKLEHSSAESSKRDSLESDVSESILSPLRELASSEQVTPDKAPDWSRSQQSSSTSVWRCDSSEGGPSTKLNSDESIIVNSTDTDSIEKSERTDVSEATSAVADSSCLTVNHNDKDRTCDTSSPCVEELEQTGSTCDGSHEQSMEVDSELCSSGDKAVPEVATVQPMDTASASEVGVERERDIENGREVQASSTRKEECRDISESEQAELGSASCTLVSTAPDQTVNVLSEEENGQVATSTSVGTWSECEQRPYRDTVTARAETLCQSAGPGQPDTHTVSGVDQHSQMELDSTSHHETNHRTCKDWSSEITSSSSLNNSDSVQTDIVSTEAAQTCRNSSISVENHDTDPVTEADTGRPVTAIAVAESVSSNSQKDPEGEIDSTCALPGEGVSEGNVQDIGRADVSSTSTPAAEKNGEEDSHNSSMGMDSSSRTQLVSTTTVVPPGDSSSSNKTESGSSAMLVSSTQLNSDRPVTQINSDRPLNLASSAVSPCLPSQSTSSSSSLSPIALAAPTPHAASTSTGVSSSAPSPSGTALPTTPPVKKKVSLLEYRKRMKQKGVEPASSSGSNSNGSNRSAGSTSGEPTTPPKAQSVVIRTPPAPKECPPTLAPLPLFFDSFGGTRDGDRSMSKDFLPSLPNKNDNKDDQDVRWNTSATTVERVREQTHLSLTERLRREFGLCEDESEEDEDKKADEPTQSQIQPGYQHPGIHIPAAPGIPIPPAPGPVGPGPNGGPGVPPNQQPSHGIPPLLSIKSFPTRQFNYQGFVGVPSHMQGKGHGQSAAFKPGPVPPPPHQTIAQGSGFLSDGMGQNPSFSQPQSTSAPYMGPHSAPPTLASQNFNQFTSQGGPQAGLLPTPTSAAARPTTPQPPNSTSGMRSNYPPCFQNKNYQGGGNPGVGNAKTQPYQSKHFPPHPQQQQQQYQQQPAPPHPQHFHHHTTHQPPQQQPPQTTQQQQIFHSNTPHTPVSYKQNFSKASQYFNSQ